MLRPGSAVVGWWLRKRVRELDSAGVVMYGDKYRSNCGTLPPVKPARLSLYVAADSRPGSGSINQSINNTI